MRVLIAETNAELGKLWCAHLTRQGILATTVTNTDAAVDTLRQGDFDALVLSLQMQNSAVLAISDFATYRNPDIAIILVTSESFFSDGSIFNLIPNARSFVNDHVAPDDLAAIVDHYGSDQSASI